jgi:hypothetical protein
MLRLGMPLNITLPLGGKSADYTRRNNEGVYDLRRHICKYRNPNNAKSMKLLRMLLLFFLHLLKIVPIQVLPYSAVALSYVCCLVRCFIIIYDVFV